MFFKYFASSCPECHRLIFWPFLYNRKSGRKYGVIECDPLVRKGLEKTVGDLFSIDLLVRLTLTQNQQKKL